MGKEISTDVSRDLRRPLIAVVGPTATGKTRRAVAIARHVGGEIISGDSRQVYRLMDLGTGKDLEEYGDVPYHLIDVAEPGTKYNLYQFLRDTRKADAEITARGKLPIVCGGTGLYVESFLKGMALPEVPENAALRAELEGKELPELKEILASMKTLHNVTDLDTCQRAIRAIEIQRYYLDHPDEARDAVEPTPRPALVVGVAIDRETRRRRITERLDARLAAGMTEEVERLLAAGVPAENLIYYGLEYKFVTLFMTGQISRSEMRDGLEIAIHQFAKRQMTWFRGMEKRGIPIAWLDHTLSDEDFVSETMRLYENRLRELEM